MLSLVSPHMQISVLPLLIETPEQEVTKFELSRCYSSLLLFVSVHFLYVPCNLLCHIDVIQQQKKAECIPCMDYTAISRITITPIYGWKSYYLVVWWPYRLWYDYPWYDFHTIFGMPSVNSEIIPILVWNSYRCFCCETISVLKFPQVQGSLQLARKVALDQIAYENEARGLKILKILDFSRFNEGTIGDGVGNNPNPTGCHVI